MRKITKKILVVFLISLITFISYGIKNVVSAESNSSLSINSSANLNIMPGEQFSTTISINGAYRVSGFQFSLLYDSSNFELLTINKSEELLSSLEVNISEPGVIRIVYSDISNLINGTAELFELSFIANADLEFISYSLLSVDESFSQMITWVDINNDLYGVSDIYFNYPSIDVGIFGDVNLDGVIDLIDVGYLQQYIVGKRALTMDEYKMSDVNNDFSVDIIDVGYIQQYLVGLRDTLGKNNATNELNNFSFQGIFSKQTYYINSQDIDFLQGAKAVHPLEGELPISILGTYDLQVPGVYEIYAVARDSFGNSITEVITLTVKELTAYSIPDELTTDQIEIELWHSNGATIENALNQYAQDFNAIYPNINITITKNGNNYDELKENMVNAIRGGEIPNIIQNYSEHISEYNLYDALVPLTPYIYHPVHGYNPDIYDQSFEDILFTYRQESSQFTEDGEYYSLPFSKSTEVMIYNKTMFDLLISNGYIDDMPDTWQGLMEAANLLYYVKDQAITQIVEKLNQSNIFYLHKSPEEIQAIKDNFIPIVYESPSSAFITLTRQWGGEYTAIDASRNGVILFDNDQTKTMLSFFYDKRDDIFTFPEVWGTAYGSDAFKIGQTAVLLGSSVGARYSTPTIVNDEYLFEFGVMPMPYNADMPEERTAIQQGTNMSITTAGTDQEKLASWLFLKYLTSKSVQLDFALKTGYSPVRYSVYETEVYNDFREGFDASGNPIYGEDLMKSMAANAAAQQSDFLFYDQAFIGSSKARSEVEAAFERVILGALEGKTKEQLIADALAAAKANAERVLT